MAQKPIPAPEDDQKMLQVRVPAAVIQQLDLLGTVVKKTRPQIVIEALGLWVSKNRKSLDSTLSGLQTALAPKAKEKVTATGKPAMMVRPGALTNSIDGPDTK